VARRRSGRAAERREVVGEQGGDGPSRRYRLLDRIAEEGQRATGERSRRTLEALVRELSRDHMLLNWSGNRVQFRAREVDNSFGV
jgi:hypothetical protein